MRRDITIQEKELATRIYHLRTQKNYKMALNVCDESIEQFRDNNFFYKISNNKYLQRMSVCPPVSFGSGDFFRLFLLGAYKQRGIVDWKDASDAHKKTERKKMIKFLSFAQ